MARPTQPVLVTGAAGGIGAAVVRGLTGAGWTVVATDIDEGGLERLRGPGVQLARLDVREPAPVGLASVAPDGFCGVVHAAGVAYFRTQEQGDPERVRELFDVNVLGSVRLNHALLPALRARRGWVAWISSVAGRLTFAESGFYAASKHAVEALAEALAEEAGPLGVRVRLIQPGAFDTGLQAAALAFGEAPTGADPYALLRPDWDAEREQLLVEPQDPTLVAAALVASLERPEAFERVPVGADAEVLLPRESRTALAGTRR